MKSKIILLITIISLPLFAEEKKPETKSQKINICIAKLEEHKEFCSDYNETDCKLHPIRCEWKESTK